ncbi:MULTISPECIES: type IV pilin N-terminal domain-containing protein [unclassified Methanoculleus]|jgi:FlaG/FlaF family flagellin (archaellin)|uniref:Type IV pilin N-terminal domain-containing protein n=1 Tax=Methanoculleus palmolei TaxID=72612 RepID=A0ABD8A5S3_9EURY|nr:type IV pilin N-terminal domain-containing protein [Methanoculleus sp. UBA377]WOX54908.1 type IV pilin N-terminal domain-containing protein [Methanoculleus palmolei]
MVDREAAVSSVIGVVLLLAIVVILAALVASFAGGAADTKDPPPSVDLAVYSAGSGDDFTLVFEHRGGDQVRLRDLRVNTWVHLEDGELRAASYDLREELEKEKPLKFIENLGGTDVWRTGNGSSTGNQEETAGFLDLPEDELEECIGRSAVVEVAVYHLPSGVLLHKSSILLKER